MRLAWLKPRRSLSGRLAFSVAAAVTAALILAAGLSVWREFDTYATSKREALGAIANMFAYGNAKAVEGNDEAAAEASLRAIGQIGGITYAAIERSDGSVLAEQGLVLRLVRDDAEDLSVWRMIETRTLQASAPIFENGRRIGRVVIVGQTEDILSPVWAAVKNAGIAALFAIAIGLGVSFSLQRSVTTPLGSLARTMDAVRQRHDYAQRAPVSSDDEVGALARTFNDLLTAVNERDHRIAAHNAHLEEEVRARTADLSEAKQVAESANAAKSTFLATMSHEIRTPMNGVLVMAELLASSDLPVRQRRYAEVIARSGQSLLAIINDILDFAKVEAGKLDLEQVPVSPAEVADTVVMLFAERARTAGLDLAAEVAPDVPRMIVGDPVRLGQVVSNFVSNALKFTQAGHVGVRLAIDPADGFLTIAVTDTGIGIPEDKLGTIFSAFSQADQSTTRRFGGTGLGLSIAQRLIEAMGGSVAVTSRVGIGSTFWARIPVEVAEAACPVSRRPEVIPHVVLRGLPPATGEALSAGLRAAGFTPGEEAGTERAHHILDAAALAAAGRRPEGAERVLVLGALGDRSAEQVLRDGLADEMLRWPVVQADWQPVLAALAEGRSFAPSAAREASADALPRFAGARVLVADDSAVNREVALESLARCGVTDVVVVEDGAAAVEAAQAQRFDLILMDGSMPVLDGFSAAKAIRAREAETGGPRTPIVALTAHVLGEAAESAEASGMDGLLLKPFTLAQLAALLQRHAPSRGSGGQDETALDTESASAAPQLAPDAGPASDLFDAEVLDGLLGLGDGAFVARIADLYRRQAPAALASLREATAAGDQPGTAQAAHSLKSMSANIGATTLVERLRAIEIAARDGTHAAAPGEGEALEGLLLATIRELDVRIEGLAAAA